MILLLSPSKTLDFESPFQATATTTPRFLDQSEKLITILRKKSAGDLKALMGISDKLAELNYERFQNFTTPFTEENARPCLYTFKGDVYDGLDAQSLSTEATERAQKHLRILSGLYGLLRPFDLMQAYRLEMGIKLENERGKSLYEFWGDKITQALNEELKAHDDKRIINLASNEYFKAINTKKLEGELVTPVFKEQKGNSLKVIGLFAKKARGMMARHLLENIDNSTDSLTRFCEAGYEFDAELSRKNELLFVRRQKASL